MKKFAMVLVRKSDGRIMGIEDYFSTEKEVKDFLKAVEETVAPRIASGEVKASGYTHDYREVEQHFYMIPSVVNDVVTGGPMRTKGHTTLTEIDEKMAKDLWLQGKNIIVHQRALPEPVDDLEQNVKNLRAGAGTMFNSMSRYPEGSLRHTHSEIWEIDKYNFKHQYGEIHFVI